MQASSATQSRFDHRIKSVTTIYHPPSPPSPLTIIHLTDPGLSPPPPPRQAAPLAANPTPLTPPTHLSHWQKSFRSVYTAQYAFPALCGQLSGVRRHCVRGRGRRMACITSVGRQEIGRRKPPETVPPADVGAGVFFSLPLDPASPSGTHRDQYCLIREYGKGTCDLRAQLARSPSQMPHRPVRRIILIPLQYRVDKLSDQPSLLLLHFSPDNLVAQHETSRPHK